MDDLKQLIASRLELAFAEYGVAEPSVVQLREAADVSLKTLYKYYPSRDAMVLGALNFRHKRYLEFVFGELPEKHEDRLDIIFDRITQWMSENAPTGCIFQAAFAAQPHNDELGKLLIKHKRVFGEALADYMQAPEQRLELLQIYEGVIQSWVFLGEEAAVIGRKLTQMLVLVD